MSELRSDTATDIEIFYGLKEYIEWNYGQSQQSLVFLLDNLIKLRTSYSPASALTNIISFLRTDRPNLSTEDFNTIVKKFANIATSDDQHSLASLLFIINQLFPDSSIIKSLFHFIPVSNKLGIENGEQILKDAFSKGQVKSKIWLIEELKNLNLSPNDVLLLAGWMGQLVMPLHKHLGFQKIRTIDTDINACFLNDYVFNVDLIHDWTSKAIVADINKLVCYRGAKGYLLDITNRRRDGNNYYYEKETPENVMQESMLPDLVINTSTEHMDEKWFYHLQSKKLTSKPVVALQSNNFTGIPEHVNAVKDLYELKKKFQFAEILYEGELDLGAYKRFMLIGRLN
jgi:hypothetical protein